MARSLPAAVRGRDATVIVVAASLLPDIDVLWSLSEPATAALNRHLLTHSLVGLMLLSTGFGSLAWLLTRRLSFLVNIVLVALAVIVHIGLDLINAYGVALLYPWSTFRFELPLVFILDPMLTGLLLAGVLVPLLTRTPASATRISRSAWLLLGCYLVACFGLRVSAEHMAEARASASGSERWTYLVPELGSPLRWKGIYLDGESYRQLLVHPLSGSVVDLDTVRSTQNNALVALARTTMTGQRIEAFLKVPVWRADEETVIAYDLRFRFASLSNDWDPFSFCFRHVGERFVLIQEDLHVYLANWRKALLRFVLLRSGEPFAMHCAATQIDLSRHVY